MKNVLIQTIQNSLIFLMIAIVSSPAHVWADTIQQQDVYLADPLVTYGRGYGSGQTKFNIFLDRSVPQKSWRFQIAYLGDEQFSRLVFDRHEESDSWLFSPEVMYWDRSDTIANESLPYGEYPYRFQVEYVNGQAREFQGVLTTSKRVYENIDDIPAELIGGQMYEGDQLELDVDYTKSFPHNFRVIDLKVSTLNLDLNEIPFRISHNTRLAKIHLYDVPTRFKVIPENWLGEFTEVKQLIAGEYFLFYSATLIDEYYRPFTLSGHIKFTVLPADLKPTPSPTPTPTPSPTPSPTPTTPGDVLSEDDLTPEQKAEQERIAALHPVLLIHGLNATPDMWRDSTNNSDYVSLLQDWGYPDEYIETYAYSGKGDGLDGYNNQGSIAEVSAGMRETIMKLRQISLDNGGDGEVDIVAHSMGGLVARQYIKEYLGDDYIDKVITIGTPFLGSNAASIYDKVNSLLSDPISNQLIKEVGVDPADKALSELMPNSAALKYLNYMDLGSEYFALYGDIKINIRLSLFNIDLRETLNIGDGIVSTRSATYLASGQDPVKFGFNDQMSVKLNLTKLLSNAYVITWPDIRLHSSPYSHVSILADTKVKSRILKSL